MNTLIPFRRSSFIKDLATDFDNNVLDFFNRLNGPSYVGQMNIKENEKEFAVEVLIPNAEKEKINIDIEENILKISYSNDVEKEEKSENYIWKEWSRSDFNKQFSLPRNVDTSNIDAKYENGILNIKIPKTTNTKLLSKIEVK